MITSYGSEESDSDSADESHAKSEAPPTSASEPVSTNSTTKPKDIFSSSTSVRHPQILKTSQNLDQDTEAPVENSRTEVLDSKSVEEKDAKYSKNQVQEPEECIERVATDSRTVRDCKAAVTNDGSSKSNTASDFDFKVSLVPGYDEDSDPEEEPEVRQERKALFPILQTENTVEASSLKALRVPDNGDSSVVSNDKRSAQELENEITSEKTENGEEVPSKPEDDGQKANKFLDNLHGRSKFFQRKKRIAFEGKSAEKVAIKYFNSPYFYLFYKLNFLDQFLKSGLSYENDTTENRHV